MSKDRIELPQNCLADIVKKMQKQFLSNRTEELYAALKKNLFPAKCSAFTKRIVIVPSLAMKQWLALRLARDLNVSCGLHFLFLTPSIDVISKYCFGKEMRAIPSQMELALRIEVELQQVDEIRENLKERSRLEQTARDLAFLFLEYRKTAPKMLLDWTMNPSSWQAKIWNRLFSKEDILSFHHEKPICTDLQIHIFCPSYLSRIHLSFFSTLPTFLYALSPTFCFWTDIRSHTESMRLLEFWNQKRVSQEEQHELLSYLSNTNPLLAELGSVGRKFFATLDEMGSEVVTAYSLPKNSLYNEFVTDEVKMEEGPVTLLDLVQADLLVMRNPKANPFPALPSLEQNIELHYSPSKLREVQVLYQVLLKALHGKQIPLNEVVVMAPTLSEYAPYIEYVFGSSQSMLPFQMMDLKMTSQSSVARGFELLLDVASSRWQSSLLLKLFSEEAFAKKLHVSAEEIDKIEVWINKLGIHWGIDEKHRKKLFCKLYGPQASFSSTRTSTWSWGLEELIISLATSKEAPIDFSSSDLVDKLVFLLRELKACLLPLEDGTRYTLKEWSLQLSQLANSFLEGEGLEELIEFFASISKGSEGSFPFSSLEPFIREKLSEESLVKTSRKINEVRFCSLLPMRAIPARIVALLGLDDDSFPRMDVSHPLDARVGRNDVDHLPNKADLDRYLFLEALLSARDHLILSFSGEEAEPCSPIQELCSYTKTAFGVNINRIGHRLDAFDLQEMDFAMPWQYQLAKRRISEPMMHFPIPHRGPQSLPVESCTVDLSQLSMLMTKPLQFYLHQTLGIRLPQEETQSFLPITPLHYHQVRKAALKYPVEAIIGRLERRGLLLDGPLRALQKRRIEEEVENIRENLRLWKTEGFVSYRFEEQCRKPCEFLKGRAFPKIEIPLDGHVVSLVGTIDSISSKGLLVVSKDQFSTWMRIWPLYLTLKLIDVSRSKLLFCQEGNEREFDVDPLKEMQKLLRYYFVAKNIPSPLIADWVEDLIRGKKINLASKKDPSLTLASIANEEWVLLWKELALDLFGGLHGSL